MADERCFHCGGPGYHGPHCPVPDLVCAVEKRTAEAIAAWAERELDDDIALWIRRGDWRRS